MAAAGGEEAEAAAQAGVAELPPNEDEEIRLLRPEDDCVYVETADGTVFVVERDVALLSPLVAKELARQVGGGGAAGGVPIALPKQVGADVLRLVLEYCRFHRAPGRSDKERKLFDERFIRLDTRRLCELTSAADSLDMKPLVDLTSRALARIIEGKTPEEIRETFHLPDDLTEEEKLEPVRNATDDPRIRLLNRLYARKRKELHERKALKGSQQGVGGANAATDERSVDELLSFIDGGGVGGGGGRGAGAGAGAGADGKRKKRKGRGGKGKGSGEGAAAEAEAAQAPATPQPATAAQAGGAATPRSEGSAGWGAHAEPAAAASAAAAPATEEAYSPTALDGEGAGADVPVVDAEEALAVNVERDGGGASALDDDLIEEEDGEEDEEEEEPTDRDQDREQARDREDEAGEAGERGEHGGASSPAAAPAEAPALSPQADAAAVARFFNEFLQQAGLAHQLEVVVKPPAGGGGRAPPVPPPRDVDMSMRTAAGAKVVVTLRQGTPA